jgi:predicted RNA binding protein YcfA (HicA-like mRNA interferase family)
VLESAHDETGCELLRTAGSHRHYSNPFRPDRLITFAWHPGGTSAGRILLAAPEVKVGRVTPCAPPHTQQLREFGRCWPSASRME